MSTSEILIAGFLHLLVPSAGFCWFFVLSRRLRSQGATWVFLGQLAFVFLCFGGLVMIVLTALFWKWSGMASLGFFFLIFVSPLAMAGIAIALHFTKNPLREQIHLERACLGYLGLLGALATLAMIVSTLA